MGKQLFKTKSVLVIGVLLLISSCTEVTDTDTSSSEISPKEQAEEVVESQLNGLVGEYQESWSFCIPTFQDGDSTCSIGYLIENPTDAIIEITFAEIYAVVDGKIFKASSDQGSDGVASVYQAWNPGEELKAFTYFNVPTGSTIEQIFFADEPDLAQAEMIFDVYRVAEE